MKLTQRLYHFFDEMIYYFTFDCKDSGFACAVKMVPSSFRTAKQWFSVGKNF